MCNLNDKELDAIVLELNDAIFNDERMTPNNELLYTAIIEKIERYQDDN